MGAMEDILAYRRAMRQNGADPIKYGRPVKEENNQQIRTGTEYDHRWDDHPSWYTDDKNKQREMVQKSIQKRREKWD